MKQLLSTLGAFALGAGTMYYFDPELGRRRRALVRDGLVGTSHDVRDYLTSTGKRAGDHAYGWYASARGLMRTDRPTDEQLHARIRSRLGRLVGHPHAIETEVHQGRVVLRGPLLSHELGALMAGVWAMRGVTGIDNQLTLHEHADDVPALQGRPRRPRGRRAATWAGSTLPALALAGGIGAGLRAMGRHDRSERGLTAPLALALLAFGLGDGARRITRYRGASARGAGRHEHEMEQAAPALGRPAPAPQPPSSTWQH